MTFLYSKTCRICNKKFDSNRSHAKTCSNACRSRVHSLHHRNKVTIRNCKYCGEKFSFTEGLRNNKRYCGDICRNKARYARESNDQNERLKKSIRCRLLDAINTNSLPESLSDLLGCTIEDLKAHLQSQFQPGMTWENRGYHGWHIDHIKPLADYNLSDPDELKKACHFTNLQPLWAKDNLSKGDRT